MNYTWQKIWLVKKSLERTRRHTPSEKNIFCKIQHYSISKMGNMNLFSSVLVDFIKKMLGFPGFSWPRGRKMAQKRPKIGSYTVLTSGLLQKKYQKV